MSILIEGMEMPKNRFGKMLLIYPDGTVFCKENESYKAIPAADVMLVRHGRWQNPVDAECYQCSVCGKYRIQEYALNAPIFDNFCPNCGAKMEES